MSIVFNVKGIARDWSIDSGLDESGPRLMFIVAARLVNEVVYTASHNITTITNDYL